MTRIFLPVAEWRQRVHRSVTLMTIFEACDASRYASQRATLRSMIPRSVVLAVFALALSGCKSYEGLYAPACAAYSGSEIKLSGGQFHWSKFTDQVVLDEQGNTVDPFPGFSREGAILGRGPGNLVHCGRWGGRLPVDGRRKHGILGRRGAAAMRAKTASFRNLIPRTRSQFPR